MKKFTEQLKKRAEEAILLRANEKHELRERLLAFMEYHPATQVGGSTASLSSYFSRLNLNTWTIARIAGVSLAFMFVVVPVLAEKALPGELLYPVKIRFNEEVRGAMVSTPYEKIEWETERLERRLAEANLLADAGKLTPDVEAEVVRAVTEHSDAAKQGIEDMRVNDSDDAAFAEIALSSALEVQSEVLTKRDSAKADSSTSALTSAVNKAKEGVSLGEGENISYEKLQGRLEAETTRAYEYFNTLNGVISDEEKREVEKRLSDVKAKSNRAASVHEQDAATSTKLLIEALGSTRKIISFMTNLDVRNNVKIDEIVPAAPSDEERKESVVNRLAEADNIIIKVNLGIGKLATTSSNYIDLSEGVERYQEVKTSASSSLAVADLDKAEQASNEALELASGLLNNLISIGIKIEDTVGSNSGIQLKR